MADPTPAQPLASLADVKQELGLSLAVSPHDALLLRKLYAASARIEKYCNRRFSRATTTDKVRSTGGTFLLLERVPVVSIGAILDPGGAVVSTDLYALQDPAAGLVKRLTGLWEDTALRVADFSEHTRFPGTEGADYTVTFDAGYVTGWHVDPRTDTTKPAVAGAFTAEQKNIPADLEEAVIKLTVAGFKSRGAVRDPTLASESLSRYSASFGGAAVASLDDVRAGSAGMPIDVVGILDGYARLIQA
jgi:hypothetical protein